MFIVKCNQGKNFKKSFQLLYKRFSGIIRKISNTTIKINLSGNARLNV